MSDQYTISGAKSGQAVAVSLPKLGFGTPTIDQGSSGGLEILQLFVAALFEHRDVSLRVAIALALAGDTPNRLVHR